MSNECPASSGYFLGSLNETIAAVVSRVKDVSPGSVSLLKFGSMGGEWYEPYCPGPYCSNISALGANSMLESIAAHWAAQGGVEVLSDPRMLNTRGVRE